MNDQDFAGRVALITGGTRGIGRAIARELGRRGATLILNHRENEQAALAVLEELRSEGITVECRRADVASAEERSSLFAWLDQNFGGLDVLVNNAGITRDALFIVMRPQAWNSVLETNLLGSIGCGERALSSMRQRGGGVIVNIGSGASFGPRVAQVNYASSKSALVGFNRNLARRAAADGIRVMLVAPGFTATDMSAVVEPTRVEASLRVIPLARWGSPEEIASIVAYLASDGAQFLTGSALAVDGGRSVMEQEYGLD